MAVTFGGRLVEYSAEVSIESRWGRCLKVSESGLSFNEVSCKPAN